MPCTVAATDLGQIMPLGGDVSVTLMIRLSCQLIQGLLIKYKPMT